jgi:hypothetical protein
MTKGINIRDDVIKDLTEKFDFSLEKADTFIKLMTIKSENYAEFS